MTIEEYALKDVTKLLVGNKNDLNLARAIPIEEAKEFANYYNLDFIEVSAKSGFNVEKAFFLIGDEI